MRAILFAAVLLVASAMATLHASTSLKKDPSPWTIIESWTKQMPGHGAMQINPAYSAITGMYFTTSHEGTVFGLNVTTHEIVWNHTWSDLTFIEAVPLYNGLVVGTASGTYVLQANTGGVVWANSSIQIMADLTNHGDRTFLMFGSTMVYRETSLGFTRVCTLDIFTGVRIWCDNFRIIGLPDPAYNNTFTAPLYDQFGQQYAANFDVATGNKNWIIPVQNVLTGSADYVAVANGTGIFALNSMTGYPVSGIDVGGLFQGSAVIVHEYILAICDGQHYLSAINMQSGELMWNVSAGTASGLLQLQRRGSRVLVLASLDSKSTNFTRFGAFEGNFMWTAVARPTGMSLTPVHGWLGNDILYCRTVAGWSAFGVDTGDLIEKGSGDLFLPRSVAPDFTLPHVGYFVTGPEGIVYALKIVHKNSTSTA